MLIAVVVGASNGTLSAVASSVALQAKAAVELALTLLAVMSFWLGLMKIAQDGGLIRRLARLLSPVMKRLFPDVPPDHPAVGAMVMNIAANMLGLNNAATPFGLKAMQELQALNPYPKVASNSMVTFLAINTSSVQLIPASAIAMLAAGGATQPTAIITTALLATTISTLTAILLVKVMQRWRCFKINHELERQREVELTNQVEVSE
jgi:spore maturation protein A